MYGVFYVATILTFITQTICLGNIVHLNIQNSNFGSKLEKSIVESKYDVHVLASCARECFYVTKCRSFSYNRIEGVCLLNGLNSTETDVADFAEDDEFIHSDVTDWEKEMVYTCAAKPCSMFEKCIPSKPYVCVAYCGEPDTISNGVVDRGGVLDGAIRTFTCVAPHVPTSSNTSVTCQSNSEWTRPNVQCVAYCGNPNNVTNAVVNSGGVIEGSVRTYTCVEGCTPTSPDTSVTCQANFQWTNPNFNCIVQCGSPPAVNNGDVGPGGETENEIRTYTCRQPYTASTSQMSVTCQQNSHWTSQAFHCQLITTCQELRSCNPSYIDGEYWLVLDTFDISRRVKIRCNGMSSTPYETLTLGSRWRTKLTNQLGIHQGYYEDITIDVKTLRLSYAKKKMGYSSPCMVEYGTISANATCPVSTYEMNFNLDHTGFRFNPIPTWSFKDGTPQSIIIDNHINKRLDVSGSISSNYGYVTYSKAFALQIDVNEDVPVSGVTIPQCA